MKLPFKIIDIQTEPFYDELFSPQNFGWQGGDAACSISLGNDRVLWLFGDTIIGNNDGGKRNVLYPHINNSLAITTKLPSQKIDLDFYWNLDQDKPRSFFPSLNHSPNIYYWPTNGLFVDNKLIIFCFSIQGNFKGEYLDFWSTVGTNMIVVNNPHDNPLEWKTNNIELGIGNDNYGIHSGLYYDYPNIFFIGYKNDKDNTRFSFLAKAVLNDLIESGSSEELRYFSNNKNDNYWSKKNDYLARLFIPGSTESTIYYMGKRKLFLCTTYNPLVNEQYILTAKKITGPWNGPFKVFENPDHVTMTYAFRIHPALMSDEDSIIFSYISSPEGDIRNDYIDQKYYRPRFIRMNIS